MQTRGQCKPPIFSRRYLMVRHQRGAPLTASDMGALRKAKKALKRAQKKVEDGLDFIKATDEEMIDIFVSDNIRPLDAMHLLQEKQYERDMATERVDKASHDAMKARFEVAKSMR